ncbi:nucleoid-associated protein,37-kD nucleoid-associated bacterial protein [[Clostridium] sordellii]|uniref:nucleoid-associated protein n=1 Tax=Paraclostridium sordellii TaxID=1505 RepID=UPI000543D7B6|nr:nucleoid-associated protein [Paeniclostridium sordellii]CEK35434.1 nucleoid-associated protein,37-kD nucleoid-associated bacterial protein [[Clostridium] sordellii] [Paeniclostridium sordellii]
MIINKYITHVLDKESDVPILNDFEGKISQNVDKFLQKSIKKVSRDSDLRKAVFKNYNDNLIKNCCESIIYDESTFVENSKEIAAYLFDVMRVNAELESCDLVICLYTAKDEKYVSILKLDYRKTYNHNIEFENDKLNIRMVQNEIAIPENSKIKQATIVGVNGINDEYQLRVLDKDSEKEEIESKWITEFLNIEKIKDDTYKTKVFKKASETWITNALSTDIKQAEDARSVLNYILKEKDYIDITKFADKAIDNEELKESFIEHMADKDIEGSINIDKKWVDRNLKKRKIKTDTGFDINGNLVDFEDPMKYRVTQNKDGSIDITIKNIKFYEEK